MISTRHLSRALRSMLQESQNPEVSMKSFVEFLKHKNLLFKLPHVLNRLEIASNYEAKDHVLNITIPHTITDKNVEHIARHIGAEKTSVNIIIDSEIIGGFKARFKNTIYDATIRTQLTRLQTLLKE